MVPGFFPRLKTILATPEFLVFLVSLGAAAAVLGFQAQAAEGIKTLTEDIRELRNHWATLVEAPSDTEADKAEWGRNLAAVEDSLRTVARIQTSLTPVLAALYALPLKEPTLRAYGQDRSRFDQGLDILDEVRTKEDSAFRNYITVALGLGILAIVLLFSRLTKLRAERDEEVRQTELVAKRRAIEESERWRIARELHDGVAQDLAQAKLGLGQLDCGTCPWKSNVSVKNDVAQALNLALKEVRWICGTLRKPADATESFDQVVQQAVTTFSDRYGQPVDVQKITEVSPPSDSSSAHELTRILQEGLTNVGKHAGASSVVVRYLTVGSQLKLLIEDNGSGIHQPAGFGMRGIGERAEILGGAAKWEALSPGTRLTVTLPWSEAGQ